MAQVELAQLDVDGSRRPGLACDLPVFVLLRAELQALLFQAAVVDVLDERGLRLLARREGRMMCVMLMASPRRLSLHEFGTVNAGGQM